MKKPILLLFILSFAAVSAGCMYAAKGETSRIFFGVEEDPSEGNRPDYELGGAMSAGIAGEIGDPALRNPVIGILHGKTSPNKGEETDENFDTITASANNGLARRIVYTGTFHIQVYDVDKAQEKITKYAESLGGYLQRQTSQVVIIRVPAKNFQKIVEMIPEIGRVRSKDISASDITEKYIDTELRLTAMRKSLESLQNLLESAGSLKEKLDVQKEINRVVEEIERLEGKLRFMKNQVAFSTITIQFRLAFEGPARPLKLTRDYRWLDRLGVENLLGLYERRMR